jgi:hypothetical protein
MYIQGPIFSDVSIKQQHTQTTKRGSYSLLLAFYSVFSLWGAINSITIQQRGERGSRSIFLASAHNVSTSFPKADLHRLTSPSTATARFIFCHFAVCCIQCNVYMAILHVHCHVTPTTAQLTVYSTYYTSPQPLTIAEMKFLRNYEMHMGDSCSKCMFTCHVHCPSPLGPRVPWVRITICQCHVFFPLGPPAPLMFGQHTFLHQVEGTMCPLPVKTRCRRVRYGYHVVGTDRR